MHSPAVFTHVHACRLWLSAAYLFFPATLDDAQGWIDRLKWLFAQLARVGVRLGQLPGQGDDQEGDEKGEEDTKEAHKEKDKDKRKSSGSKCVKDTCTNVRHRLNVNHALHLERCMSLNQAPHEAQRAHASTCMSGALDRISLHVWVAGRGDDVNGGNI